MTAEPPPSPPKPKPHYHGHRARLRQRFLEAGGDALADYELLELLLFSAIPRRDVKPIAKDLMTRFGGLAGVLGADPTELEGAGLGPVAVVSIKVVQAAALRLARAPVKDRSVLLNWDRLLDYCAAAMAHERTEQFRVLFLDRRHGLIRDEVQNRGTIDHTPAYPREVVRRALEVGARYVILVHNHPSGDPTPSKADIDMTRAIVQAGEPMDVGVHDHIIIGHGRVASFKSLGLL